MVEYECEHKDRCLYFDTTNFGICGSLDRCPIIKEDCNMYKVLEDIRLAQTPIQNRRSVLENEAIRQ